MKVNSGTPEGTGILYSNRIAGQDTCEVADA